MSSSDKVGSPQSKAQDERGTDRNFVECDTFARSSDAVFELSTRFAEPYVVEQIGSAQEQADRKKLLFLELTQVCLWGNSTDLSLLINASCSCLTLQNQVTDAVRTGSDD